MTDRGTGVILSPDIVALLQEMGLAWDEVQIYQYLLNASSAVSSAIVRETGHSRGRIYEALRRLVGKGLVREEPTRPIQFHPTPLAEILANAHARLTRQLAAVQAGQAVALKTGEPEVALPLLRPARTRDVRVLSGRRACQAEWSRMLSDADSFFWLMGGGHLANRVAATPPFLKDVKAAQGRGLSVHLIFPKTAATSRAVHALEAELGSDVVRVAAEEQVGPLVSCATDHAAMEVIVQPDDDAPSRGEDVAIQVSSQLFATAVKQRFQLAESFLKKTGSPPPYQWLGPNHGSDLFLKAVTTATKEVLVLGPREWSTYLAQDWERTLPAYRAAKGRGVRFRALTSPGAGDASLLGPLVDVWDIRLVDGHPVWLTIVDGRELYQAFTHPSLGGPPQFRRSQETNEIRFYHTVFERLWETARPAKASRA